MPNDEWDKLMLHEQRAAWAKNLKHWMSNLCWFVAGAVAAAIWLKR